MTTSYAAENGETPGSDSGNEGTTDQGATEDTKIEPSEIDDLTGKEDKLEELNSSGYLIVNADGNNNSITTIKVVNKKGIFPSTGGIGAAIFAIIGLGLMTVAFIGYRRKKVIE